MCVALMPHERLYVPPGNPGELVVQLAQVSLRQAFAFAQRYSEKALRSVAHWVVHESGLPVPHQAAFLQIRLDQGMLLPRPGEQ